MGFMFLVLGFWCRHSLKGMSSVSCRVTVLHLLTTISFPTPPPGPNNRSLQLWTFAVGVGWGGLRLEPAVGRATSWIASAQPWKTSGSVRLLRVGLHPSSHLLSSLPWVHCWALVLCWCLSRMMGKRQLSELGILVLAPNMHDIHGHESQGAAGICPLSTLVLVCVWEVGDIPGAR